VIEGAFVVLGTIVIVRAGGESSAAAAGRSEAQMLTLLHEPLACVEVLGRSVLQHAVERFRAAGVGAISVLIEQAPWLPTQVGCFPPTVDVQIVSDVDLAVAAALKVYAENGIEHVFVVQPNAHIEADLIGMFQFHRETRQPATRAFDREGALDLWMVNAAAAQTVSAEFLLPSLAPPSPSFYPVKEYVRRLSHPRHLRRLVEDSLRGLCQMRPSGREIRPGVWIDQGAQIHKRARLVAPAYVGCNSRILEDTLITRFSNIERNCYIDYGTVIEDSSILANSHVGIWLDVCHSVVQGNRLFNLGRDTMLEISDPSVIRRNGHAARESKMLSSTLFAPWASAVDFSASGVTRVDKKEHSPAQSAG
jgi:NDP-sugar pyrophosphorylase family protein